MKDFLKKQPIEFWFGINFFILAILALVNDSDNKIIQYYHYFELGFIALFTASIIIKLNKISNEIKELKGKK